MATYSFPQFKVTITDPTVIVDKVNDSINSKTCNVDVILQTTSATFGVNLIGFTYVDTWEDSDIIAWVDVELQNYIV
jgi:hypothetical protein